MREIKGTYIQYLTATMYINISESFLRYKISAFPLKTLSDIRKTQKTTWMTKGLLKSLNRKQKSNKRLLKSKSSRNKIAYQAN